MPEVATSTTAVSSIVLGAVEGLQISTPALGDFVVPIAFGIIVERAKHTAGQALSRLLNLTDGLLGQGRNVLVGVTTNEDLERLHPAVVRPGRCLARIEVGPLTLTESVDWLGTSEGVSREGATLAELYALRRGQSPTALPSARDGADAGLYL